MLPAKSENDNMDRGYDMQAQAGAGKQSKEKPQEKDAPVHDNKPFANIPSPCSTSTPSKYIRDLNEFITCNLCKGYLIDATTIIECLHSFCRACIVKYMDQDNVQSRLCPKCNVQIHKTKPKQNIRSDPTLQDIVYKLVPKLYKEEMSRRKEFYLKHPDKITGLSNEEKGEIHGERLIISNDDNIQLTIEYFPEVTNPYKLLPFKNDENQNAKLPGNINQRRYLLCKAGMKVLHLKKFIRYKYDLDTKIEVDFFYKHELLKDDYTIMDLAYIYSWRRNIPIPLYYLIVEPEKSLWLLPQIKMTTPQPNKAPKNRSVLKNIPEPTNCNAQLNGNRPANRTNHLVSPNQRKFGNPSKSPLPSSTLLNSHTPIGSSPATSVNVEAKNKSQPVSDMNKFKRKINEGSGPSKDVKKKTKVLLKENVQTDSKSQTGQHSDIKTEENAGSNASTEEDSSTDISDISESQVDITCKPDNIASCNDKANCNSDANPSTSSTQTTAAQQHVIENSKGNHPNTINDTDEKPPKALSLNVTDSKSKNISSEESNIKTTAASNLLIDICMTMPKDEETNKVLNDIVKKEQSTLENGSSTLTDENQVKAEHQNHPTNDLKECEKSIVVNKENNGNCLDTALPFTPSKPDVTNTATNGQLSNKAIDSGIPELINNNNIESNDTFTPKQVTLGICSSSESTVNLNSPSISTTNGNYSGTFLLTQFTQNKDFFPKTFTLYPPTTLGSSSQANSINLDVKMNSSVKPVNLN